MLTREEVVAVLGEVDDVVVSEIIATGATPEELAEARAWVVSDEALVNAGRPFPKGRVSRVLSILERMEAAPQPGAPDGGGAGPLE